MSSRFVELRRYATQEEAGRVKAKLASEKIPSMVEKDASAGLGAGLLLPVKLLVRQSDKSRALSIVGAPSVPQANALSSLLRIAALVVGLVLAGAGLFLLLSARSRVGGVVLLVIGFVAIVWALLGALLDRRVTKG